MRAVVVRFVPFLLAFFIAGALMFPEEVQADTVSDLQAQINSHQSQIEALQREIAQYQKELDSLGTKKTTLQSAINSLTLSQKQLSAQIQVTQNKISSTNLEIQRLSSSIGDKETTIAANEAAIGKAMREIAHGEKAPLIVRLISSDSLTDAWDAAEQTANFNRALSDDIDALREARATLSDNREKVMDTRQELVSLNAQLATQKRSVDANKAAQQQLLTQTKNQEANYQKLIADKQAEEEAFEAALFELSSRLQYVLDPSSIPAAGKGVLRWPLDSVFITQQFGRTIAAARLYTSGTHDGIDFRATVGTPVRAALSGTVVEINTGAAPNCQYGKWVLIRHPNGLSTLYAHLSTIDVSKGQAVGTRQIIGLSGMTGYATGPHLHFTVYASDAVSFRQYRCKSGATVTIPIAAPSAYLNPLVYL